MNRLTRGHRSKICSIVVAATRLQIKNVKSDDSAKAHGSGLELALCIDGCLLRLDVSRTGGLHWFLQSWVALRGGRTARKHPQIVACLCHEV